MTVAALAVLAALGVVVALVVEVEQRGQLGIRLQIDRAAGAAVTPVGAAARHELLASEADAAGAAVTALDKDVDLIDEGHGCEPLDGRGRSPGLRAV